MAMPFEMVIGGPPVSQQARDRQRRTAWRNDVRRSAAGYWGDEDAYAAAVMVSIAYFFDGTLRGADRIDVDNIPKPILDALKGLVYDDDTQVIDLLCRKRALNSNLRIRNASPMLSASLQSTGHFLHIMVNPALVREVAF